MPEKVKKESPLSARIAKAISKIDDTYDVLAQNLGVSRNTIMAYKRCQGDIKGVVIENLVKFYRFNPSWLLSGEPPMYKTDPVPDSRHEDEAVQKKIFAGETGVNIPQWDDPDPEQYHFVPMATANLNAGGGSFVLSESTTGRYYAFRKKFLSFIASSPKNLILMKVTGDSMEPKIEDGDTVMIDVGKRSLKSGAIYALGYDDVVVIKEIEKLPGNKALVISRNRKMYPPYEADINDIRIIGQIVWGDRTFIK